MRIKRWFIVIKNVQSNLTRNSHPNHPQKSTDNAVMCQPLYSETIGLVRFSFLGWGETESTWYVGH
jgi:hypothetical protein